MWNSLMMTWECSSIDYIESLMLYIYTCGINCVFCVIKQ
jgi:hypothetical protein